jgi:tetratricopeptide (TPR) repeat protein
MSSGISRGRQVHIKAEKAREDGRFLEALKFTDEATVLYQEDGDVFGFCDIQASRFITLKHLWEKTGEDNYMILAKHATLAGVEIARKTHKPSALIMPLFRLAQAHETLGEFEEGVECYKEAIENFEKNPPEEHNRPAVLLDMKIHLGVCEYKAGGKIALSRVEKLILELEKTSELKYNKDVWLSGAHMKLAEVLKSDNSEASKTHLVKAKEIVDANPKLVLRKKQWEKLNAKLAS